MTFLNKVLQSFVVQIVILVCSVGSSILTARYLGPEGRGELAVLQSMIFISTYLGNLGVHASIVYFGARATGERVEAVFSTALIVGILSGFVLTVIVLAIAVISPSAFPGISWLLITVASLQILPTLLIYFIQHLLLARDRIKAMNVFLLSYAVLNLILPAIVFLVFHAGLWEYVEYQTLLVFLLMIGIAQYVYRHMGIRVSRKFSIETAKELMSYGFISFLAGLMSVVIMRSNIFFINHYLGANATGNYAVASRFGDSLTMLPTTVGFLLMPRISADPRDIEITPRISRILAMVLGFICIVGSFCMAWIVRLLYGNRFDDAVVPSMLILFAYAFLSLELIYANYMMGRGYPNKLIFAWIPALIVNIVLNIVLIPRVGLVGAALSSLGTYILVFALVFRMMKKLTPIRWWDFFAPRFSDLEAITRQFRRATGDS